MVSVTADPTLVAVTAAPQPLVGALGQGDQITIANFDLAATVYVGYSPSVGPSSGNTVAVAPLASAVIDASRKTWIVTGTGLTATVQIIPGAAQWQPSPLQAAQQLLLNGIGAPVPQQISSKQAVGVAGGAIAATTFTIPVGGAYQLVFYQTSQLGACVADITVQHQDVSNNIVYTENFTVAVGSIGNFSPVIYRGNLQAGRIIISGQICTQAYLNALPIDTGPFTVTGLSMAVYSLGNALANTSPKMIPSNTTNGVLGAFQATSLGAGLAGARVPLFSYVGRFKWDVFSASAGFARAAISFFTVAGGSAPQGVLRTQNDATVSRIDEWVMQGMLGVIQMTNEGGTTANLTSHAIICDYI